MTRSIPKFAVGGLIALIVGMLSVGLIATFVYVNGRSAPSTEAAREPVDDAAEQVVPDGAA